MQVWTYYLEMSNMSTVKWNFTKTHNQLQVEYG